MQTSTEGSSVLVTWVVVVLAHSSYLNVNSLRSLVIAIVVLNKSLTRPRSPLQKQQSQRSTYTQFRLTCPRLIAILDPSSYLTFPFSFLLLSLC